MHVLLLSVFLCVCCFWTRCAHCHRSVLLWFGASSCLSEEVLLVLPLVLVVVVVRRLDVWPRHSHAALRQGKKEKKKAGWWGAVRAQSCQACEGALWKVLMWPAFHARSLFDFGTFLLCLSWPGCSASLARKGTNLQETQRVRVTVPREVRGGEEVWP